MKKKSEFPSAHTAGASGSHPGRNPSCICLLLFSFISLLEISPVFCPAQRIKKNVAVPVDTSFNINSEFRKQQRYFPAITVAKTGNTDSLAVLRDLVYTRYGDRRMQLDLFFRKDIGDQKLPVIVFLHGGGWRSGDRTMDWPMAVALAGRGYAVACVEYRLSVEALYPAGILDVKTAIRWLRANSNRFWLDGERFALAGSSSGGQMAALTGTINGTGNLFPVRKFRQLSDKVQAVVDIDGVLAFLHPESGEGVDRPGKPSAATMWFGASSSEKPDLWREASALNHTNPLSAPVLFINSAQPRFHAGRDDFMKKMEALGIYCEAHTIPDTPHTFWLFNPWFDQTVGYIDQFLKGVFQ